MAKPLLAALQGGKISADLVDKIGAHLKPLMSAATSESRCKEACRTYGPFLLPASQLVGQALGKKGLDTEEAQVDWLEAARHLLGGLMVIAPYTKCKHPLQLEKLAMGLIQKHLDARLYVEVQPHVDALVTRLVEVHGHPSEEDRRRQRKALEKYPAHKAHAAGQCARCCDLMPRPDSDGGMCALALASLQARMACVIGQGDIQSDALVCCSCANLVWVERAGTIDVQLARRSRGRLVHMLHEASGQQRQTGDRTIMPFRSYLTAIDVIMLAGARPENVGIRMCVDHMIKIEEHVVASGTTDRVRVAVLDGYKQAISCVTRADAARNSWAVVECLRLVERYATLCTEDDLHQSEQMWQTFIDWCRPPSTNTVPPVNMLIHAAGAVHLSMSKLRHESCDAADQLRNSADMVHRAQEVCFEEVHGRSKQADEPPLEYIAMLRLVIRGGVLVKLKDFALDFVQSPPSTASEVLLAIEALLVQIVDILVKACDWEQNAKLPAKFGSAQLVRFRLGALHVASVARMEHGLLASARPSSQAGRKTKKTRLGEDAVHRESMEAAISHLRTASNAAQAVEAGNVDLRRYVSSFSYNAAIRLSKCERNEEAIQALTLSCEQLQACSGSNEDVNQALCARWTLFAKCKDKMEDIHGIVECLKDVVMQVGASLSIDPSADRTFFAPLVFQHVSAYLKPCMPEQTAEPKGKGKGKGKGKSASTKKSRPDEETQGRVLMQFLNGASKQISACRFGMLLEEYLVQVESAGNRLKLSTEDMQLAIINKLLLVYGKNDKSIPHKLGRARAVLHKARFVRAAGKLSDLESAAEIIASAVELLASLRSYVKDGSTEHRQVLEHVAIVHTFHGTLCTEQQAMRSTNVSLASTAGESFATATAAFTELILGKNSIFCDIEEVWSGLQMLSEYYRLMADQAMELHFLRLRLRLVSDRTPATAQGNSQCESCVHPSDRVTILAEASMMHTQLGFSEQAVALADEGLRESLKLTTCVHSERADALVRFAKALGHCRSTLHSQCVQTVQELLDKHSAQRGRSWSAVDAYGRYVLAEALWAQGNRLHAAQVAMDALQMRVSLAPGCQDLMADDDNQQPMATHPAQSIHDGEDAQELVQVCTAQTKLPASKSIGTTSNWGVLHNLLESLLQAGSYACRSGRGVEGESYIHKALTIAERLSATAWKARIQCVLTELYYLRHDDRYKAEFQPAVSLCTPHSLAHICALTTLVDFHRKNGDLKSAISTCEEGIRSLEVMRHPKFLKDRIYKVTVDNKSYSVVDDIGICGQQAAEIIVDTDAEPRKCLFPYQLEQAHAKLELKQGQVCRSSGDNTEATKLFKRALKRTDKDQPLQAIALYRLGCQHILQCSAKEETVAHKWSLHDQTSHKVKSTARKGRGRKVAEDGACMSKQFKAAQDNFEQALCVAIAHDMAGLASKICHRLAIMHGRQAPASCRMLQASLCVPLSNYMQSLLVSQAEQIEIPDLQAVTDRFCVSTLVSASAEYFQERYIDNLAPDWTVCSCTVDHTDDGQAALLVSRMVRHRPPVVVRIPMGGDGDGELNMVRTVTTDWERLIQRNIDSLKGGGTTTKKKLSTKEKTAWWDRRSELDDDMKSCLQRLEQSWLGGLKGLLLGQAKSLNDKDVKARASELKETVFGTCAADPSLIELVLSSTDVLNDEELQQACTDILVGQVGSFREEQQATICELAKTAAHEMRQAFSDLSNGAGQQITRGPTILLLGQEVQQLPWESLPCFRRCGQSVTRMPALPFVLARHVQQGGHNWLWHVDPGVQPNRTFYVLNPAGDLATTQATFEEAFTNRNDWEGFTGTAPSCDAYKTGLYTKDLFIYCGHSTGERYLRGSELAKLSRCAVTMLMGCSSGKLRNAGTFGVEGMPLNYVLAGCPALVANLWDVTDKDIDKFSSTLLDAWVDGKTSAASTASERKARSLPEELPQARKACKFLYLNGAAPVCYGVPCVPVAATT